MKHPFLEFKIYKPSNKKYSPKKCSARLKYLFTENENLRALSENKLELMGLLDMVGGLEYHHRNFVKIENNCRKLYKKIFEEMISYSIPSKNAIHEMTAYLNRLNQIVTLFKSSWFKKVLKEKHITLHCRVILALLPLRNKFAAHRSVDAPKNETISQQANHASIPFGLTWSGRATVPGLPNMDVMNISYQINISKADRSSILKDHPSAVGEIEIFSGEEIWITFIPVKHHDLICKEIIDILEQFFS